VAQSGPADGVGKGMPVGIDIGDAVAKGDELGG